VLTDAHFALELISKNVGMRAFDASEPFEAACGSAQSPTTISSSLFCVVFILFLLRRLHLVGLGVGHRHYIGTQRLRRPGQKTKSAAASHPQAKWMRRSQQYTNQRECAKIVVFF